ncbi:MAG TPA: histidine kinase [Gemmatimonadales bacterium]|nr:histidine kinase [Gemmatimonadales bacterium]
MGKTAVGETRLQRQHLHLQVALVLGGWTTFGLFSFGQILLYNTVSGEPPLPWRPLLVLSLVSAWTWAALTPAALWVAGRLRFTPGQRARGLALHGLAGIAFVLLSTLLDRTLVGLVSQGPLRPFMASLLYRFDSRFLAYLCIVTVSQAARYAMLYRQREVRAAELEAQLARAELQLLKMQLQPHFLFNALNTIAEMAHNDPNDADRLIARLGHLLRLSLEQAGHQVVPLRQELQILEAYLEIEQTRFRDRLVVRTEVAPEALEASVPALMLQPLVENAIRYGTSPGTGEGRITIRAAGEGPRLRLEVSDRGPGFPRSGFHPEGLGLRNTRERLRQLYGAEQALELGNGPEGGAVVTILLPFLPCHEAHTPLHLRIPGRTVPA